MSLSLINFSNRAELESKLKWHASTKSNKKDKSKANKPYAVDGGGPPSAGELRSSFELQRYSIVAYMSSLNSNPIQGPRSFPANASKDR